MTSAQASSAGPQMRRASRDRPDAHSRGIVVPDTFHAFIGAVLRRRLALPAVCRGSDDDATRPTSDGQELAIEVVRAARCVARYDGVRDRGTLKTKLYRAT